jgi:preprotein translocase subunit YajC
MGSLYIKSFGSTGALGYENPAFKIKIVSPNDDLQQKQGVPRRNPRTDFLDNLEVGDVVSAVVGKETIVGKISKMKKNGENDVVMVEVVTNDGKKVKVDATRIRATDPVADDVPDNLAANLSTNGIFQESRVLSFQEFISL